MLAWFLSLSGAIQVTRLMENEVVPATKSYTLNTLKGDPFLRWAAEDLMSRGMPENVAVETVINTYTKRA